MGGDQRHYDAVCVLVSQLAHDVKKAVGLLLGVLVPDNEVVVPNEALHMACDFASGHDALKGLAVSDE